MKKHLIIRSPLRRDGTSQQARFPQHISPELHPIDDRQIQDLLHFAHRFATQLQYYSTAGLPDGDWTDFVSRDCSFVLAGVLRFPLEARKAHWEASYAHAEGLLHSLAIGATVPDADLTQALLDLLDALQSPILYPAPTGDLTPFRQADQWHLATGDETIFRQHLSAAIAADLVPLLQRTMRIHFELSQLWLGTPPVLSPTAYDGYSTAWTAATDYLADLVSTWSPGDPVHYVKGDTVPEMFTLTLRALRQVQDALMGHLQRLQGLASDALRQSLTQYDLHQPHAALFITFLRLFQYSQQHLNTLTRDHLHFFFREVLRQQELPAQPDSLHAILSLKPGTGKAHLPKGTALSAGKDASGSARTYLTDRDMVLNEGAVAQLKTLHRIPAPPAPYFPTSGSRLHVAQVAQSATGEGKPQEGLAWPLMGSSHLSDARWGFSIASPQLALQGGHRTLRFIFQLHKGSAISHLTNHQLAQAEAALVSSLRVRLSGAKAWQDAAPSRVVLLNSSARRAGLQHAQDVLRLELVQRNGTTGHALYFDLLEELGDIDLSYHDCMIVEVSLDFAAPAVVPFTPAIGGSYGTDYPVAEFLLDNHGISLAAEAIPEVSLTAPSFGARCLFMGNVYEPMGTWVRRSLNLQEHLGHTVPAFGERTTYAKGTRVLHEGKVFEAIWNSVSPVPLGNPEHWEDVAAVPPVPFAADYDPLRSYAVGQYANYDGRVYRALRASTSPEPGKEAFFWKEVDYTCNLLEVLEGMMPASLLLKVSVFDLPHLVVENDLAVMRPDKPFEPFGSRPQSGAQFLIGCGEALGKKLSYLGFTLQWQDAPTHFADHYVNYPTPPANTDYKATVELLNEGAWVRIHPDGTSAPSLFHPVDGKAPVFINAQLSKASDAGSLRWDAYRRSTTVMQNARHKPGDVQGFLRLTLVAPPMGFGHSQYAELYTRAVSTNPLDPPIPAEPYTPLLKGIKLHYTSTVEVPLDARALGAHARRVERFHHITPFGTAEQHAALLLPTTPLTLLPTVEAEGALHIGVKGITGDTQLSLLFQLLDGSGDPELSRPEVQWQVLGQHEWLTLTPTAVVHDSTLGLRRSGIVELALPATASTTNPMMPTGHLWIRVRLSHATAALHKGIAVLAQAVPATFKDNGNDPAHYAARLPAGSVTGLATRLPWVSQVAQPFPSFGARPAEDERRFLTRVSEFLRHKGRAVTPWDYERITLEAFPALHKVKCIPHSHNDCEIHPGDITLVTIPDVRGHNGQNPYEPRTSLEVLEEVRLHLQPLASPAVRLHVCNPLYEQVRISAGIGFKAGLDAGYHLSLLQRDLQRFLSPWAFEEGREVMFGGRIHRSTLLHFIEERPYVDYVVQFRMDHIVPGEERIHVREAITTTARSVLVTAEQHQLLAVHTGDYLRTGSPYYDGIGHWIIPADFLIS